MPEIVDCPKCHGPITWAGEILTSYPAINYGVCGLCGEEIKSHLSYDDRHYDSFAGAIQRDSELRDRGIAALGRCCGVMNGVLWKAGLEAEQSEKEDTRKPASEKTLDV